MDVAQLATVDQYILRPRDFEDRWIHDDMARMEANGAILRVARGAYVLVPEAQREPNPAWRPNIERVALGLAAATYGVNNVALVGLSAARVHGAIPRPLGIATVSYPSTRPRDIETIVGTVRTYRRSIDQMDVVRVRNDLVHGYVTSPEMTMLDLVSKAPKWPIGQSDRAETIRLLAARADWDLTAEVASLHRKKTSLAALKRLLRSEGVELDSRI